MRADGNHRQLRIPNDVDALHLQQLPLHVPLRLQNPPRRVDVPADAVVEKGRPAGGDVRPGPTAGNGGRGVDAARPVRLHGKLVLPVLLVGVHDHRAALGGVAVLVRVGADASDALDGEVDRVDGKAGGGDEGHQKAAQAGVHVDGDVVGEAELKKKGEKNEKKSLKNG